jgi:multicomponent Na+:H+ antiporter subunit E
MINKAMKKKPGGMASHWPRFWRQAVLLSLIWLGLNGPDYRSWLIGMPVVLAAAALGVALRGDRSIRLRWRGLLPFAAFFVVESLRGGWDVARRVLHRRLPLDPGFVHFSTSLPPGAGRFLFVNVVSLLPGTVSTGIEGDRIVIHTIDVSRGVESDLRDLEQRVAGLFAEEGGAGS